MMCRMDRPIARDCFTKVLPKQVGTITKALQGKFVEGVRASWIVIADKKLSLCALATEQGEIACHVMLKEVDDSQIDVAYVNGHLYFSGERATADYATAFTDSLAKAGAVFNARIRKGKKQVPSPATATPPQMSLIDAGGGCYMDEDSGSVECIDGGSGSGGGGGGGSGGGGGVVNNGWTCTTVGGLTSCTTKAPKPDPYEPLPFPGPSQPQPIDWSLCGLFRWFCSAPEPAPIPAPIPSPIMNEAERYRAIKNQCIADCSNTSLPTPAGNDGWNFYMCLNSCMAANGYPNG